jgi:hypothetical protein
MTLAHRVRAEKGSRKRQRVSRRDAKNLVQGPTVSSDETLSSPLPGTALSVDMPKVSHNLPRPSHHVAQAGLWEIARAFENSKK